MAPVPRIFTPKSKQTFKNVKEVWDQYPSPAIAIGKILAYRLMHKSLAMDGGNDYLGNGLHYNVRQDFINTDDGVALVEHINSTNYGFISIVSCPE